MINRKSIEDLVRQKLSSALRPKTPQGKPADFVNEENVLSFAKNSTVLIAAKAIVTPAARDTAEGLGIRFQTVAAGTTFPDLDKITLQTIVIGSDHAGFALKEAIENDLKAKGYDVYDVGTHTETSVDYPDFAYPVALLVGRGYCKRGIVVDGAGIGSAIVANKVAGVRAANCHDLFATRNSREHNNSNVLTLGSRIIGSGLALEIIKVWLSTPFGGERHQPRIDKISKVEERESKCHT
jgi:ribose 5-phosphate isomerase B